MSKNPRKASVDIIYNVLKKSANLSDELSRCRRDDGFNSLDLRLISEITNGAIRNLGYLDYIISFASDIKLNKISPYVLCILRIGVYQILFMDKIPQSAAVNECVRIIKSSSNRRVSGFVNAVLRKVIQTGRDIPMPEDKFERLCIEHSCPIWIADMWRDSLGDEANELITVVNKKPGTILRVNTLKTTINELLGRLTSEGWICSKYISPVFPNIDYLISADRIENIEECSAYKEGLFYIQDSAAAYVTEAMDPLEGSVVFDMCASPGGKTTHIAEKMRNNGKVYAFDVSMHKINRINQNLSRLGITCVNAQVNDSSLTDASLTETADYVLVDAPCSGLGIIQKKPDIKYSRKMQDISALAQISLKILSASSLYVKHGGTLVFSTCTTSREENEGVLFEFLKNNPEFHLKKINCNKENDGYITFYPHRDGCDGFFISLMIRD